jgi:hypothetical protein
MLTSLALMSIFKAPHVPLREISQQYFGLSPEEAQKRAARMALPVPTFRLTNSQKAPLMVSCEELGAYIDDCAAKGRKAWEHCQP